MMIKTRTAIKIPESQHIIDQSDHIIMMGSCFSDNVGEIMKQEKFAVRANPLGITYNPISLSKLLDYYLLDGYEVDDVFCNRHKGVVSHPDFHSKFNDTDEKLYIQRVNTLLSNERKHITSCDTLVLTFGTAWVYKDKNGNIVSNCHKLPSNQFLKSLLTLEEILVAVKRAVEDLRKHINTKIILTVSPVRHSKDGLSANNLSKSILLQAAHQLVADLADVYYFPAYEIMMDDLRDYRFYAEDMLHPNALGISYIYEVFKDFYFTEAAREQSKVMKRLWKAINHKPFLERSNGHIDFCENQLQKLVLYKDRFPHLDFSAENKFFAQFIED